uniref:ubiquitinyl hydrolase 1 n=1 Tax=Bursaphelenchus xylophilus TaxID=6326 RepID=A0A1I7RLE0_BURXY
MASTSLGNGHQNCVHSSEPNSSSASSTLNRRVLRIPAYAFILPNFDQFPDDFRRFLEKEMIEIHTLKRLEASGHLNWWCLQNASQRLWPLVTTGDGNCLLHAASLGIWGIHDRQLNLRQALYDVLTQDNRRNSFYRRWRWHESKTNLQSELVLNEDEWEKEWKSVIDLASATPRPNTDVDGNNSNEQVYESLEAIHVFALAQVLRRPIIVVADTVLRNANGEELAPIPFGGVYLPLEFSPDQCHRGPLVLCYDASHFSALVAMRQSNSNYLQTVPIIDRFRNLLPVHFSADPGPEFTWWRDGKDQEIAMKLEAEQSDDRMLELMGTYMDIVKMDLRRGSIKKSLPFVGETEFAPSVPLKLMAIASGKNDSHRHRFFNELRQHFRWLTRKSKRKSSKARFSATELRQSNCVLAVLLHNYSHQYIEKMFENYLVGVRERYERYQKVPSSVSIPKNRLSRSFSSSSVHLSCLNCKRHTASLSTTFLCSNCFEDQKREMASLGSSSSPQSQSSTGNSSFERCSHSDSAYCSKSSTMPALSDNLEELNIKMKDRFDFDDSYQTAQMSPRSPRAMVQPRSPRSPIHRGEAPFKVNVTVKEYGDYGRGFHNSDYGHHTPQSAHSVVRHRPREYDDSIYYTPRNDPYPKFNYSNQTDNVLINRMNDISINSRPRPTNFDGRYTLNGPREHSIDRTPVFSPVQRFVSVSPNTPLAPGRGIYGQNEVLTQN